MAALCRCLDLRQHHATSCPTESSLHDSCSWISVSRLDDRTGASSANKWLLDVAKVEVAKLVELRDKLREAKDAYWSQQVGIQAQVASGWVLFAEGKYSEGLNALSAAADAEDKTEKATVTPGPLAPARELYGAMLMERNMPREALAAFEATLAKEPNRLRAMAGAAKAAEHSGDRAKAKAYHEKILATVEDTGITRPEVSDARAFLKKL